MKEIKNLKKSIKRLTILADHLQTMKSNRFDLDNWAEHDKLKLDDAAQDGIRQEDKEIEKAIHTKALLEVKEGFCGTSACAFGSACMIPSFVKKGLALKVRNIYVYGYTDNEAYIDATYTDKNGNEYTGFKAAEKFFKISNEMSHHLFDPMEYTRSSKYYVIKRIRSTIKKFQKELDALLLPTHGEFVEVPETDNASITDAWPFPISNKV